MSEMPHRSRLPRTEGVPVLRQASQRVADQVATRHPRLRGGGELTFGRKLNTHRYPPKKKPSRTHLRHLERIKRRKLEVSHEDSLHRR